LDQVRRYGAYLRLHAERFRPLWDESRAAGGITLDPVEFAAAAVAVATGPVMSPGYVRWHSRVVGYAVGFGEDPEPGRLVCSVTLATPPPPGLSGRWVGWHWVDWVDGRRPVEPPAGRHAALGRLELRWPVEGRRLPQPYAPQQPGIPNLHDAQAAVRAVVEEINATAGPVLAALEGGGRR
jgi:hypothetical protein